MTAFCKLFIGGLNKYAKIGRGYTTEEKDWWATDVKVEFDKLKAENPDAIGWIRFDNQDELGINYPILYSGDNQKYLRTDLHGNSHIAGCIFLEGLNKSDFSDYYNIIYGHNMNDGSMFGSLKKYKDDGCLRIYSEVLILFPESVILIFFQAPKHASVIHIVTVDDVVIIRKIRFVKTFQKDTPCDVAVAIQVGSQIFLIVT